MALLALLLWPVLVPPIVARRGPAVAVCVLVVGGYLLLPERVSVPIPALPDYDKGLAILLSALIGGGLAARARPGRARATQAPEATTGGDRTARRILVACGLLLLVGPVLTWQGNQSALVYGERVLAGLRPYDVGSMVLSNLVIVASFLLGYAFLTTDRDHRILLRTLFVAGVAYAALAAFEIRMSPQLNIMVYDFFPHSWRQHIRGGGFRPVVFLQHGLWLGFFMLTAIAAGLALARGAEASWRARAWLGVAWMFAVFALSKNLGAMILLLAFGPLILLLAPRLQVRAAAVVVGLFLAYPVVWQAGLVPKDRFVGAISAISEARAQSFAFRLDNEERLIAKALEKPVAGWGSWGRNRVFDDRGRDLSVTDGLWIIQLGSFGWMGYVGLFGLICFPVLAMARSRNASRIDWSTAALCIVIAANCVYLVPNSALSPIGWLIAGAVAGRLGAGHVVAPAPGSPGQAAGEDRPRAGPRYSRFGGPAATRRARGAVGASRPRDRGAAARAPARTALEGPPPPLR